jgi:selT/selW/selH-like putative selenoprotein
LRAGFPGVEIELVESGGGAFEVSIDGEQIFSKLASGRFPAYQEIPEMLGP